MLLVYSNLLQIFSENTEDIKLFKDMGWLGSFRYTIRDTALKQIPKMWFKAQLYNKDIAKQKADAKQSYDGIWTEPAASIPMKYFLLAPDDRTTLLNIVGYTTMAEVKKLHAKSLEAQGKSHLLHQQLQEIDMSLDGVRETAKGNP